MMCFIVCLVPTYTMVECVELECSISGIKMYATTVFTPEVGYASTTRYTGVFHFALVQVSPPQIFYSVFVVAALFSQSAIIAIKLQLHTEERETIERQIEKRIMLAYTRRL